MKEEEIKSLVEQMILLELKVNSLERRINNIEKEMEYLLKKVSPKCPYCKSPLITPSNHPDYMRCLSCRRLIKKEEIKG